MAYFMSLLLTEIAEDDLLPCTLPCSGGLTHVQHAMLLVNSKILAICGYISFIITLSVMTSNYCVTQKNPSDSDF